MKKILVVLFMFCQFSFFVEALDKFESKHFYEIEYDDTFFEMGSLYNKGNYGIIIGMGIESKYKNSYTIYQNCFDLVHYKNNFDLRWTPSVFLGNSMVKIGTGIPLGIGVYIYEDILNPSISIGIRPSVKLTIKNISFEAYYQYLMKVFISHDAVKSNEFGLILKISTCTNIWYTDIQGNLHNWDHYYLE